MTVPGARTVTVGTSVDDGKTWRTGTLVPAGTAPVTLRVTATDKNGNSIKQTIVRAYGRS